MIWHLYLLAAVQAVTEFFPVSSSGHLVLFESLIGAKRAGLEVEVILHLATFFSLVVFFRRDLWSWALLLRRRPDSPERLESRKWLGLVLISCVITGSIALFGRKTVLWAFDSPKAVCAALLVMGVILLLTRCLRPGAKGPGILESVFFGLAQSLALLPGISRSGITIACLLLLGIEREKAFRFSFLASMPLIAMASMLEIRGGIFGLYGIGHTLLAVLLAFALGLACLKALRLLVMRSGLHWFGFYCTAVGVLGFLMLT